MLKITPNKSTSKTPKPLYPPKNYQKWSRLKQKIHNNVTKYHTYREGFVYWVNLGENIGAEEDGKNDAFSRPAVVVRGFSQNLIWIVPFSHTPRTGKYYHRLSFNGETTAVILSQLRSIDVARISGKNLGKIGTKDFKQIRKKLQAFLDT